MNLILKTNIITKFVNNYYLDKFFLVDSHYHILIKVQLYYLLDLLKSFFAIANAKSR